MSRGLLDLSELDLSADVVSQEDLRSAIPQDFEFRMVDGISFLDVEEGYVVGYKKWDDNPWWARGHVPGRPLMPGVLMMEGAAQVATVLMKMTDNQWADRFIGLGGIDNARFRQTVVPPATIHYVAKVVKWSRKIARFKTQCINNNEVAMEMDLVGVLL